MTVQPRIAGRVILVNAEDRVLLLHGRDPAGVPGESWWITPGGGVEAGETTRDAAMRELLEETGIAIAELGDVVHRDVARFAFNGVDYEQSNDFYLARVDAVEVHEAGRNDLELAYISEHRWWSVSELAATTEVVFPVGFAELLPSLLAGLAG